MKCPFCEKDLVVGKPRLFETLYEHVCDPNGEDEDPGERPAWVCTCEHAVEIDAFWDESGDIYTNSRECMTVYHSAIDSMARKIDIEMNLRKLRDY
jgi:hypothetical protein